MRAKSRALRAGARILGFRCQACGSIAAPTPAPPPVVADAQQRWRFGGGCARASRLLARRLIYAEFVEIDATLAAGLAPERRNDAPLRQPHSTFPEERGACCYSAAMGTRKPRVNGWITPSWLRLARLPRDRFARSATRQSSESQYYPGFTAPRCRRDNSCRWWWRPCPRSPRGSDFQPTQDSRCWRRERMGDFCTSSPCHRSWD